MNKRQHGRYVKDQPLEWKISIRILETTVVYKSRHRPQWQSGRVSIVDEELIEHVYPIERITQVDVEYVGEEEF